MLRQAPVREIQGEQEATGRELANQNSFGDKGSGPFREAISNRKLGPGEGMETMDAGIGSRKRIAGLQVWWPDLSELELLELVSHR